jgi:hypothetical protein
MELRKIPISAKNGVAKGKFSMGSDGMLKTNLQLFFLYTFDLYSY